MHNSFSEQFADRNYSETNKKMTSFDLYQVQKFGPNPK